MKIFYTLFFSIGSLAIYAQELVATETQALLTVLVVNEKEKPLEGEKVSFVSSVDHKKYTGVTKADGKFQVLVPEGDKYKVEYKSFTEDHEYSDLDIPSEDGLINFDYKLIIETPKVYNLNDVFFEVGKSNINTQSAKELDQLVEYMRLKKTLVIEIAGHTDNVGDKDANQKLSQERANSVRNYLLINEIAPERVVAKGYGDTQPVDDNSTEAGRKKNRRTEVRMLKE